MTKKNFFIKILMFILLAIQFFGPAFSMDESPDEADIGQACPCVAGEERPLQITNNTPSNLSILITRAYVEGDRNQLFRGSVPSSESILVPFSHFQEYFSSISICFTLLPGENAGVSSFSINLNPQDLVGLTILEIIWNELGGYDILLHYDFTNYGECVICLDNFSKDLEEILVLPCGHFFHNDTECFRAFYPNHCPVCQIFLCNTYFRVWPNNKFVVNLRDLARDESSDDEGGDSEEYDSELE